MVEKAKGNIGVHDCVYRKLLTGKWHVFLTVLGALATALFFCSAEACCELETLKTASATVVLQVGNIL